MKIRSMAQCALFAALLCICAWISVPTPGGVVSMQTFALFLTLLLLGGKLGSVTTLVYLLLGCAGLPVFTGFRGGFGAILGPTGGFLWGFLAAALVYWLVTALGGNHILALILGLLLCYTCGIVWYQQLYPDTGAWAIVLTCVVPYLLPDGSKLALALLLSKKIKNINPLSRA